MFKVIVLPNLRKNCLWIFRLYSTKAYAQANGNKVFCFIFNIQIYLFLFSFLSINIELVMKTFKRFQFYMKFTLI